MAELQIGGETFRVRIDGDPARPPLMLANSLGTDLRLWDPQVPVLAERFRVIRYDSRGHGGSLADARPLAIGDLGRDALAILDALEVEKTHVLGISMGGAIVQWLMAHAPERLERAVLACTAAKFGTPEAWNTRILAVRRGGTAAIADATMGRWFGPAFSRRDPAAVARVRAMFEATPAEGYVACCAALRDLDLREALRGCDTPALVLTGADDPVISASDTACLLDALTNARHIAVGARHIANIEAQDRFLEAVVGFLTAKLPGRRRVARQSAPAAATPRGHATRHALTARLPLAKPTTARKAKVAAAKAAASEARTVVRARRSTRAASTPAVPTTKTKETTQPKTRPAKSTRPRPKAAGKPMRRPTKTAAARVALKKATTKAKPRKATKKTSTKTASKRLPSPRRTSPRTPRRPSGRPKT